MGWIAIARDAAARDRVSPELLAEARAALPGTQDVVPAMLPRHPVLGRCRLCGTRTLLTREHMPPAASGNRETSVVHTITDWLARSALDVMPGGKKEQGGIWGYTLCSGCNNHTGRYGTEYKLWARTAIDMLRRGPPEQELDALLHPAGVHARFDDSERPRPGALVRQVLSMFCSLSSSLDLAGNYPAVRRIVLDGVTEAMPAGMSVGTALYYGPKIRIAGPFLMVDLELANWPLDDGDCAPAARVPHDTGVSSSTRGPLRHRRVHDASAG